MIGLCKTCARLSRPQMISGRCVSVPCNSQNRKFSLSAPHPATKKAIEVKRDQTNLQKTKHLKYSDEFISKQVDRFKLSRRRLANMMGDDPDSYTDVDVNRAIRYLFPSDLEEGTAPNLEDPEKVYTSRLKIHWDETGRPNHYLYYTMKQHCNELLHQIYQRVLDVRNARCQITSTQAKENLDLTGTRWMTKEELDAEILNGEGVPDDIYRRILAQFERLLEEENAYMAKDFILQHRKKIPLVSMLDDVKEPKAMDDGRYYVLDKGRKKTACSELKMVSPGTGRITVNGKPFFEYFHFLEDRQTVLAPLCFLGLLAKVDVEVKVEGGYDSRGWLNPDTEPRVGRRPVRRAAQAHATRHAIARALRSFVSKEDTEMLRRAGLLTLDQRWKERKLPGQHKARKKHTWKRR